MPSAGLGEPDDVEVAAPAEVGGVDVGAAVRVDRGDRAECRRVEEFPRGRRDPRGSYGTVRSLDSY
jgi:hypothetical protein